MNDALTYENYLHDDFGRLVLAYMVQNETFLARSTGLVKPEYFGSEAYHLICETVQSLYRQFDEMPAHSSIVTAVCAKTPDPRLRANFEEVIQSLYAVTREEFQVAFLEDSVVHFAQRAEAVDVVKEAHADLREFSITDLSQDLTRIVQLPSVYTDDGRSVRRFWPHIMREDDAEVFLTGWPEFDGAMRGGLRGGELCCILAPLKRGKSLVLSNIGARFLLMGYRVAHITLEMYTPDVIARYCSILLNVPTNSLAESRDPLREFMENLPTFIPETADIIVKHYPARTCTVDMLDGYLSQLQANSPVGAFGEPSPIIPIIDYGDLLLGPKTEEWKELSEIYVQLRNLARKWGVPVITASQTNAGGFNATDLGAQHQSGSTRKGFTVDYMWAVDQNDQDYKLNRQILTPILNRNERKDRRTYWEVNYTSGLMLPISFERYTALDTVSLKNYTPKERAALIRDAFKLMIAEPKTLDALEKMCAQQIKEAEDACKKKGKPAT